MQLSQAEGPCQKQNKTKGNNPRVISNHQPLEAVPNSLYMSNP